MSRPRLLNVSLLTVLFAFSALLSGCGEGDYRPEAVGQEGVITVVIDSTLWKSPVGDSLQNQLAPYVETLPGNPQRSFQLDQVQLTQRDYGNVQKRKNVVFVGALEDTTSNVSTFLRRRLSQDALRAVLNDGQKVVAARPNLWRKSQRIYFIAAATPQGLVEAVQSNAERVRSDFHMVTLERMGEEMFSRARQQELEDSLMTTHGFAVNVQHDYVIVDQDRTDSTGTVYLRRVLSDTWRNLTIHYIENASPSIIRPEWIYNTRDSLASVYQRGSAMGFARIDYRRPLKTEEINFLDRYAFETRGLWNMVVRADSLPQGQRYGNGDFMQVGGGGPFVTFSFYDQPTDRVYMISGSVFAPGYNKLQFIRQMEVIARTFRTRQEAQSERPAVASRSAEDDAS